MSSSKTKEASARFKPSPVRSRRACSRSCSTVSLNIANSVESCWVRGSMSVSFLGGFVDGFGDVGFEAFGVGGPGATADEQDEFFGAVAAEVNFFHDRGSHVAVDDFAGDYGGFFD